MYGNDYDYANSRLEGTIIRHKGKPVFYLHSDNTGNVQLKTIVTGRERSGKFSDLDFSVPTLGFVVDHGCLMYISRKPLRRDWRQGLRENNVTIKRYTPMNVRTPCCSLLYKCITQKFPKVSEAIETCKDDLVAVALSPDWAIIPDGKGVMKLNYRYFGVAGVLYGDGTFKLKDTDKYRFTNLKESLSEVINAG